MTRFGTFFDGELARQDRACLGSFARHGHDLTVFSYHPLTLPEGVRHADANAIVPHARLFRVPSGIHKGSVSQFSNFFRYSMIAETGLIWIDTDIVCLSGAWPEREWMIARQDQCLINNAVLGCPRDHPALMQAIAVAERMLGLAVWGLTGPHLLTALSWEYGFNREALPANSFYPLHYSKAPSLLRPLKAGESLKLPKEALCVHLWNEVLRQAGHDRLAPPPPGSALAGLIDYAEAI